MIATRWTSALICAGCVAASSAATLEAKPDNADLAGFELKLVGGVPCGWTSTSPRNVAIDESIKHGGTRSLLVELPPGRSTFNSVARSVPADPGGGSIELHGHLRAKGDAHASLWLRVDGDQPNLAFTGGDDVATTGEWIAQTLTLDDHPGARTIVFGARMTGSGTVWLDDIELLVDGRPVAAVPETCRITVLDRDHEFDAGSQIAFDSLNAQQVDALVLTTRVWGLLKYHHPAVVSGQRHWDYELFRHLPAILAAQDRAGVERELVRWIDSLPRRGSWAPCAAATSAGEPRLAWIDDARSGRKLRARLQAAVTGRACAVITAHRTKPRACATSRAR